LIDFRQHWQVRTNDYPDWVIVVVLRTCQNNREIIRLTWGLVFAFVQHVQREAPFIAYELTRQGLVDAIKEIMGYPPAAAY
jgi:putative SOS response-associated peptidase YedK